MAPLGIAAGELGREKAEDHRAPKGALARARNVKQGWDLHGARRDVEMLVEQLEVGVGRQDPARTDQPLDLQQVGVERGEEHEPEPPQEHGSGQ